MILQCKHYLRGRSPGRKQAFLPRAGTLFPRSVCLILSFILLGSLALAQSTSPLASITELKNNVHKKLHEKSDWQGARLQDVLETNNSVRTGQDAVVQLTYVDGTIVRLAPNTTLTLQKEKHHTLHLLLGKIWVRITKSGSGTRIKTPSALATIMGSDVIANVESNHTSSFTVLNTDPGHRLHVQALDPFTNSPIGGTSTAHSSQQIIVTTGNPAPPPQNVNVQQILQQEQGSGFLTERQSPPSAAPSAAPSASAEPTAAPSASAEPAAQPTTQPTAPVSAAPTARPVQPSVAPVESPAPNLRFNPALDAPILPSQELDRTGSDVTGRINIIFQHDGPPHR